MNVYDWVNPPPSVGIDASEGIGADQSFAEEADINTIMRRIEITGDATPFLVDGRVAEFMDVSDAVSEFHAAMNIVAEANSRFAEYPWPIRSRFDNDPAKLIAFVADPKNTDEAVSLGLATARPVVPAAVPPIAPVGA